MSKNFNELQQYSYLDGDNAIYLESLYEQYLQDPQSVSPEWQQFFATIKPAQTEIIHSQVRDYFAQLARQAPVASTATATNNLNVETQLKIYQFINAYRRYGHLRANIDPLKMMDMPATPMLDPTYYGLNPADSTEYAVDGLAGLQKASINTIINLCQKIYASTLGFEYCHIDNPEEANWLQSKIEMREAVSLTAEEKKALLNSLTQAEGLEKYLASTFAGEKRFSLEGGETLIPILHHMIESGGAYGLKEVVIGMAHRGRLNVLVNIFGKPTKELFSQFDGTYQYAENRSDDVKYHYGYSCDVAGPKGPLHLSLGFNPSHLEIISPVVEGSARARQDRRHDQGEQVMAIQIHGDSAFAGQGIVMETFSLSQTRGFKTGGSIHIVINNQVGFTTHRLDDTRSTFYCTDIAKMINAPIIHVNSDAPESALFAAKLALDYRQRFKKDVVIDLVCYRRLGHNEGDEPAATQPLMYKTVKQLPTTRKLYAEQLVRSDIVSQEDVEGMQSAYRALLDAGKSIVEHVANPEQQKFSADWSLYESGTWQAPVKTALDEETLHEISQILCRLPENFKVQPQVNRAIQQRFEAFQGNAPLIWGDAEILAYASLLKENFLVRLVGQDAGRGTFAHRHAVLHDQDTGEAFTALQQLDNNQAKFTVIDSLLSEEAVMAFEYGYACTEPRSLVLWEAQYGDFANTAQVVIDQFLSAGEQKWGRYCGLVLLLPHGLEAAGPEHSSARLERYLQLCAQQNMQVCIPTTPAQIFHLLRRQALRPYRKPLIIMTPKGYLRKATSTLSDITSGEFQVVIPENRPLKKVRRVIICSGRVYYDLLEQCTTKNYDDIALIRLEQIYPFPIDALKAAVATFSDCEDVIWCQEEHKNQGAWYQIEHHLEKSLSAKQKLRYIGRPAAASPAAGYKKLHQKELTSFLQEALS